MSTSSKSSEIQTFPWFILCLMASVTFVGILSELVPSGILPQMTDVLASIRSGECLFKRSMFFETCTCNIGCEYE